MTPVWLFQHTITVEPYAGQSGRGPLFDPPVTVKCFLSRKRTLVRVDEGSGGESEAREVTASTTAYCDPDTNAPPGSRVTVDGRVSTVVAASRHDRPGVPHHLQLAIE